MTIEFTKAEGSQNDFVIIDDRIARYGTALRTSLSVALCHRRKGIGADGVIFIDTSEAHDFTMSFFNPDGSVGSMCGNGGRCAALYAWTNGIAGSEMTFEVLNRPYRGVVHGETVRLYFPEPLEIRLNKPVVIGGEAIPCQFANTGAPHAVVFAEDMGIHSLDDLKKLDVARTGYEVRHSAVFGPAGTNANFVFTGADGTLSIRTFEKGVENETEACGTGTIAAAILAHLQKGLAPPLKLETRNGDVLTVGFTLQSAMPGAAQLSEDALPSLFADGLYFEGRTNLVFQGTYSTDSL